MNQISALEQHRNIKFGTWTYLWKLFALLSQFLQFLSISPSNGAFIEFSIFLKISKIGS